MKKGSKVRVLSDNRIGVVADQMFFTLGGKKTVRVLIKFEGQKEPVWIDRELVTTELVEKAKIIFFKNIGESIQIDVEYDHDRKSAKMNIDRKYYDEIIKCHALHACLCMRYLEILTRPSSDE